MFKYPTDERLDAVTGDFTSEELLCATYNSLSSFAEFCNELFHDETRSLYQRSIDRDLEINTRDAMKCIYQAIEKMMPGFTVACANKKHEDETSSIMHY